MNLLRVILIDKVKRHVFLGYPNIMKSAVLVNKEFFLSSLKESGTYVSWDSKYITAFLVLSDNSKIILGNDLGHLTIWCLTSFSFLKSLEISKKSISTIGEISGSNRIVTSSFISDLTIIDSISFVKISQLSFTVPILCLKGLNDQLFIITSLGKLSVLDTESFEVLNEVNTRNFSVTEFCLCEVNEVLILACRDKRTLVYSSGTLEKIAENSHSSSVTTICISSESNVYASGEANGTLSVFSLTDNLKLRTLNTGNSLIRVKFLDNGRQILSLNTNNALGIYTTESLEVARQSKLSCLPVKDFQVFEGDTKIACFSDEGSIIVVEL